MTENKEMWIVYYEDPWENFVVFHGVFYEKEQAEAFVERIDKWGVSIESVPLEP